MNRTLTRRQLVLAAALRPGIALAQGKSGTPDAGIDYREVKPAQPTETGNKIEVLEFFWYGCPHCASLAPDLEAWRKKLPADVEYRRLPVAFDESRTPHSKIFYALQQLGKEDALHMKVFNAIVNNRQPMLKSDEIADFMVANGIDRKQWLDAYNSFSVATKANRAMQVWKAYKIDGTPSLGVDGKWVTAPSMVGSRQGALAVMDFLIVKARNERQGKKT
jgi:thiol:disulfide interchange protein DsbA